MVAYDYFCMYIRESVGCRSVNCVDEPQCCYWALARIHTFGRRATTNPSLQWHLNEPRVLIQRAFLQGLCPVPRPAHSSISRGRKREEASKYVCPSVHTLTNDEIIWKCRLQEHDLNDYVWVCLRICIHTHLYSVFASGPVQIQYCTRTSYPDRSAHTVH